MTTCGYIGMGAMGSAMTERLLSCDVDVVVFDVDDAAVERASDLGAVAAASAAGVAASCDIISVCVPAAEHVDAVLDGPAGIVDGAHDGLTVLVHSTVHPDTVAGARDRAAAWGAAVHDACVAGGEHAARAGELAIFAGGHADMAPAVRELLAMYGSKVIDAGPVGAGAALKIGVNVMTYAQQAAARTAIDLVDAAGGSTDALVDAWRHIGQLGRLTEQYLGLLSIPPEHITGELRASLVRTVDIGRKDLALAAELSAADGPWQDLLAVLGLAMPEVMGLGPTTDPTPTNGASSHE